MGHIPILPIPCKAGLCLADIRVAECAESLLCSDRILQILGKVRHRLAVAPDAGCAEPLLHLGRILQGLAISQPSRIRSTRPFFCS